MKKNNVVKKLSLNKETVSLLREVSGGLLQQQAEVSAGPAQCWFSECASC